MPTSVRPFNLICSNSVSFFSFSFSLCKALVLGFRLGTVLVGFSALGELNDLALFARFGFGLDFCETRGSANV